MQLPLLLAVAIIYLGNKLILIPALHDSSAEWFVAGYLNDLFAPIALLSLVNISFALSKRCMADIAPILLLCTISSLAWEFSPIALRSNPVSDWLDIVCYVFGSLFYYLMLKLLLKKYHYPIST